MLIEKIRDLNQGTVIPKPRATADFKIKGWGERRGEAALTYCIPNHKTPTRPLIKGITVTEFERAYNILLESRKFTRHWFNINLSACAKEGACNFTTIGGIFQLLKIAQYVGPGIYALDKPIDNGNSSQDLNVWFDKIVAELLEDNGVSKAKQGARHEFIEPVEMTPGFKAAVEGLGKLFGSKRQTDE